MTGMRLVEVIPTTDDSGVANQLYESTGGVLQNLSGPVLVVYAPPSRQQVPRNRYPRVLPPVIRQGEAARVRDAAEPPTDSKFLEALHDEYAREGPLRQLREQVLAAPHRTTKDFRVIGEVLWRVAAGRYQLVLGEDSPLREVIFWEAHDSAAAGHTGREKTLERVLRRFWWENAAEDVAGSLPAQPVRRCDHGRRSRMGCSTRTPYPSGIGRRWESTSLQVYPLRNRGMMPSSPSPAN